MGTTCCSLPSSTPIRIRACFTRQDLDQRTYSQCGYQLHRNLDLIANTPALTAPFHIDCVLTIGASYSDFIQKVSRMITPEIVLVPSTRYIRYETAYGLQIHSLHRGGDKVTFNQLLNQMPFVDWSADHVLTVWFDSKQFTTSLDAAIKGNDVRTVSNLLGVNDSSSCSMISTQSLPRCAVDGDYVELEGESAPSDSYRYPFPLTHCEAAALLSMNDEVITSHLIRMDNDQKCSFHLDSNAFVATLTADGTECSLSRNMLIEGNIPCIFKLSPFYIVQWHIKRYSLCPLRLCNCHFYKLSFDRYSQFR